MSAFELLVDYIREGRITLDKTRIPLRATYHDPCNYGRKAEKLFGQAFYEEPRWIMDQCLEDWVEMHPERRHQVCCGGGGGTLLTGYDEERTNYGRFKMERILATGAEMVVVPCHSCHGQFNNIKQAMGLEGLQVKYLWELVADCMVL